MPEIAIPADWRPERKIVAAAIVVIILWVVQLVWPTVDIPSLVEGALTVLAGYLIPNR